MTQETLRRHQAKGDTGSQSKGRFASVGSALLACARRSGPRQAAGPKLQSTTSELAVKAYGYAYPRLVFDRERHAQCPVLGVSNQLSARTTTSTPFSRDVLAPNADTASTTALLDLRGGPLVVLSMREGGKRYTRIDPFDASANVFALLGQRTEGNQAANFAIVGPTWTSPVAGVTTLRAPANYAWLHGQVAALGERDVPAASGR